jgi:type I restriction enzyme S subunit
MLPNKGGISLASSVPSYGSVTEFCQGDVLLSNIRPYFKKIWKATRDGFCSNDILALRVKNCICDSFLFSALSNDAFFDYVMASAKGTKMPRGDKQQILEYPILLPPLPTQRKIAAVLSSLDDKIENNRKICANLEAQAQAIFKSWFVDFEPFGGKMPQGWKMGKLGELIEVCYGKDHKALPEGDIPVFGSGGYMRSVDRCIYDEESVLIPRKGTLNNIMYVNEPFWTVDTMFYSKMREEHVAKYVHLLLQGKNMDEFNVGSAVPSMTTEILNNMEIIIPLTKTLQDFDGIANSIYAEVAYAKKESRSLAALRDALLPKLMSGEIDVEKVKVA